MRMYEDVVEELEKAMRAYRSACDHLSQCQVRTSNAYHEYELRRQEQERSLIARASAWGNLKAAAKKAGA